MILDASRSCRRIIRVPSLSTCQSSFGEVLHDSFKNDLCRRSLVSSLESRIWVNASMSAAGSLDPNVEKSSCATPRPVRIICRSLLMAFRSALASRTCRAKLLISGITCDLSQRVHSCRSTEMLAWAIEVFSAAHLAATVLERGICRYRAKPEAASFKRWTESTSG